eukprot:CAMPEP_0113593156 /NCGR_PEP_ID=MMETSP0015_2-20120614/38269_1 /TAXON_ID=2838 /ORGANISM="Odontella" /LENGTH=44 /DNA_ID=CAMNT_0000499819 /DNA_START=54 /DNA_END=184 /DNA_ORIENTATION=+ /assembly_acc=CAM_ASM_000160
MNNPLTVLNRSCSLYFNSSRYAVAEDLTTNAEVVMARTVARSTS